MKFNVSYDLHDHCLIVKYVNDTWCLGKIYFHKNSFVIGEVLNMKEVHKRWNGSAYNTEHVKKIVADMAQKDGQDISADEVELIPCADMSFITVLSTPAKSGDDLIFDIWMNK